MNIDNPRAYYESRVTALRHVVADLSAKANLISRSRIAVFAVWVALFFLGILGYVPGTGAWLAAGATFIGFLVVVAWDEILARRIRLATERAEIGRIQIARLDRAWKEVPELDIGLPEAAMSVSNDLGLFGHASLYQLICRAHTTRGSELVRDWIIEPASSATVAERNRAATTLAAMREYREELDLRGRLLTSSPGGPASFVAWAEGDAWMKHRVWLKFGSRGLVASLFIAIALGAFGLVDGPIIVGGCLAVVAANLLISVLFTGAVHDIFDQVDSRHHDILHYTHLLEMFDKLPNKPAVLGDLKRRMGSPQSEPWEALSSLMPIMKVAQMRHSPLFGVIHLGLQLLLLIDFHVLVVLELWQGKHGHKVRDWFEAVAELEALGSLASLIHDQPDWACPTIDVDECQYLAEGIGHPLLPNPVRNCVKIGPQGRFLLVSGSNMSGKSTLLRAIGLNAILAQAGAPVCATSLTMPPMEVATSMRIQDSLEDGISFFLAELQRLKEVVDHAISLQENPDRTLLYLLDEILQGTNSAERRIAVARVIHRVSECGAMGAISTHDLELATTPELAAICDPVHFRESFSVERQMMFDYRMREGVATTTNALKLLEMVGLA